MEEEKGMGKTSLENFQQKKIETLKMQEVPASSSIKKHYYV